MPDKERASELRMFGATIFSVCSEITHEHRPHVDAHATGREHLEHLPGDWDTAMWSFRSVSDMY